MESSIATTGPQTPKPSLIQKRPGQTLWHNIRRSALSLNLAIELVFPVLSMAFVYSHCRGCVVTDMIMFSMITPGYSGPPDDPMAFTRYTLQHKFFGEVLWIYVSGHEAFAVIHQLKGNNVFGSIFNLRRAKTRTP
jgi:hypothetical protein